MKFVNKSRTQQGLTLIEVMISLVILMLVSTLTINMLPLSKVNERASQEQTLTLAVKQYMEGVAANWKDKAVFNAGTVPAATNIASGYTCTTTVSDPDSIAAPGTPMRRRLVLTCKSTGNPDQVFVTEYGRP